MINELLIKAIAPIPKVEKYDSYLFVGPHPDDIEIAAGRTVARLCAEGKAVTFLICTDGRYGTEDRKLSPDALVDIRREEQLASAAKLGVKEVKFLPFHDGGKYAVEELRDEIAKVIVEVKPDIVLCPDYQLFPECHPDHLKVGRACAEAYMFVPFYHIMHDLGVEDTAKPQAMAFFYTDKPNAYVKIRKKDFEKSIEAFSCFKSQFDEQGAKDLTLYMKVKTYINGMHAGKGRADAFRAVNNLHVHCCTEL